jgi:UDP-GlcNAc:undecaprenyl-phosphate GlcNAc-1-phosphate transferase
MLWHTSNEGVAMGLVFAVALASGLALTPLARKVAWRIDAVSRPDGERKRQRQPTALLGGLAVYASFLIGGLAAALVGDLPNEFPLYAAIAGSAGMLCLLGLVDDLCELRARTKLAGQIAAAIPVIAVGLTAPSLRLFGTEVSLHGLSALWTIGWLVLAINATNLIDGMDGLASTIGIIGGAAIAAIGVWQAQPALALPALALTGALAGFVVHNVPPAKIYLGDSGSMPIGLILAVLSQQVSRTGSGSVSLPILALLLFVPLLDTGLAVVRRTLRGRSFMTPDYSHMHHQLLSQGKSVWITLLVMGALAAASAGMAFLGVVWGRSVWSWAILGGLIFLLARKRLVAAEELQLARQWWAERRAAWLPEATASRAEQVRPLKIFIAEEKEVESGLCALTDAGGERASPSRRQAA